MHTTARLLADLPHPYPHPAPAGAAPAAAGWTGPEHRPWSLRCCWLLQCHPCRHTPRMPPPWEHHPGVHALALTAATAPPAPRCRRPSPPASACFCCCCCCVTWLLRAGRYFMSASANTCGAGSSSGMGQQQAPNMHISKLFVFASPRYGAVGQTEMGGVSCINNNTYTHHPAWQLVVCQQRPGARPLPLLLRQWSCGLTLRRFSISCGCFSPRL